VLAFITAQRTPYQVRHTHTWRLIDRGFYFERVSCRLGHADLTTTTRYVKLRDEEDSTAAAVMTELLKAVGTLVDFVIISHGVQGLT
jgi:integrase